MAFLEDKSTKLQNMSHAATLVDQGQLQSVDFTEIGN